MRIILFTFAIIITIGCSHPESSDYNRFKSHESPSSSSLLSQPKYQVIKIKDGDTFEVSDGMKSFTVRLAHIDCPEKKQPFGNEAKQFSANLCEGQSVTLVHNNQYDRNNRLISEVVLNSGKNINKELVLNGLAWHFKKYSSDEEYARLETYARELKVGLWSHSNPTAPWDWRKK